MRLGLRLSYLVRSDLRHMHCQKLRMSCIIEQLNQVNLSPSTTWSWGTLLLQNSTLLCCQVVLRAIPAAPMHADRRFQRPSTWGALFQTKSDRPYCMVSSLLRNRLRRLKERQR